MKPSNIEGEERIEISEIDPKSASIVLILIIFYIVFFLWTLTWPDKSLPAIFCIILVLILGFLALFKFVIAIFDSPKKLRVDKEGLVVGLNANDNLHIGWSEIQDIFADNSTVNFKDESKLVTKAVVITLKKDWLGEFSGCNGNGVFWYGLKRIEIIDTSLALPTEKVVELIKPFKKKYLQKE